MSESFVSPTTKTLVQYNISARELAKVWYCPKNINPRQQESSIVQKNNLLEPVRPPGDQKPQRFGQYGVFASFACKSAVLSQIVGPEPRKLLDSTAFLQEI